VLLVLLLWPLPLLLWPLPLLLVLLVLLVLLPQTFAVPPPPQVAGEVQVPQELTVREVPQLSLAVTEPQFLPRREQKALLLSAVQEPPPQTFAVPPPAQVCGEEQVPQLLTVREVPQLSLAVTEPQFLPRREQNAVLLSAVHVVPPQTFAVPPPAQVCGEVQVPQELTVREVPQLSLAVTEPQFLPRREQNAVLVSAVQVVPPHVSDPPDWYQRM